ncbi:MAG: hypothetical protein GX028_06405 [Clostridiaceae bacterium]|nr:hypothetical protein [Clostridiaceae bacterium]
MTTPVIQTTRSRRRPGAVVCLFISVVLIWTLTVMSGCVSDDKEAVGAENYNASLALLSYEMIEGEFEGVLYREVNSYSRLIASADVPVLTVFYNPMSDLSILILPLLEEMAVEYNQRLMIVLADVDKETVLAEEFDVETMPQFSIIKDASLKRSLIGFDDDAPAKLRELVELYLN